MPEPELGAERGRLCRVTPVRLQDVRDSPTGPCGEMPSLQGASQFWRILGLGQARGKGHVGYVLSWSSVHTPPEGTIDTPPGLILVFTARRWRHPSEGATGLWGVLKIPFGPL